MCPRRGDIENIRGQLWQARPQAAPAWQAKFEAIRGKPCFFLVDLELLYHVFTDYFNLAVRSLFKFVDD